MTDSHFPAPESPLQAVVFDMDGLMLNTEDIYQDVGTELCRRRGHLFEDDLRGTMMGQPARAALQVMIDWHRLGDSLDDLAAESEQVFWEFVGDRLAPMPGLLELMDLVDRMGLPKAIATSGERNYADELLTRAGVRNRFELVFTADDIKRGKPNPEIYLLATSQLGVVPEHTLVLEDSQNGCRAAVAAGTYAVAVPSGHTAGHEYEGAKFVASSLSDARIPEVLAHGR